MALQLIKESDIDILIPILGDRIKFRSNLEIWRKENSSRNEIEQLVSICTIYSRVEQKNIFGIFLEVSFQKLPLNMYDNFPKLMKMKNVTALCAHTLTLTRELKYFVTDRS